MSAGATVFTTGFTGWTSSNGLFGSVRRAFGDVAGSGRNKGSDAGFSAVEEVFGACRPVRRGRVDWAVMVKVLNDTIAVKLIMRKRADPVMASDCIRERVRFESSDQGLGKHPSDAQSRIGVAEKAIGSNNRWTQGKFGRVPTELSIDPGVTVARVSRPLCRARRHEKD